MSVFLATEKVERGGFYVTFASGSNVLPPKQQFPVSPPHPLADVYKQLFLNDIYQAFSR
jgi:hypothetical protein